MKDTDRNMQEFLSRLESNPQPPGRPLPFAPQRLSTSSMTVKFFVMGTHMIVPMLSYLVVPDTFEPDVIVSVTFFCNNCTTSR